MTRGNPLPVIWIDDARGAQLPCIALVPGEDAPLLRLDLPEGLRGMARERVAGRQAADRLGLTPESLEVRPLSETGGAVLVVDPGQAETWRQAASGGACVAILPDYLMLDSAPGLWTLHVAEGRVLARLGDDDGFAAELPLARLQLARALGTARPSAVLLSGDEAPELDAFLAEADLPIFTNAEALAAAGYPRPTAQSWEGTSADLLQSSSAAIERLRANVRRWRVPVLLGALALAFWVADMAVRIDRAQEMREELAAATAEFVRETFVPSGPLLDIRAQVSRRAAELARSASDDGEGSPLALLRRAAPAVQESNVRLQTVVYRAGTGMEASVAADDFATVEALARDLREEGVSSDVIEALADGSGGVLARLRLGGS